eukprot:c570_g1_i1.p1 GENE.c570_g1_i1~~c570_g1_i1.p1  ORF type:complete len:245 (+),score=59.08 c570_g1_i1:1067-1801(+)
MKAPKVAEAALPNNFTLDDTLVERSWKQRLHVSTAAVSYEIQPPQDMFVAVTLAEDCAGQIELEGGAKVNQLIRRATADAPTVRFDAAAFPVCEATLSEYREDRSGGLVISECSKGKYQLAASITADCEVTTVRVANTHPFELVGVTMASRVIETKDNWVIRIKLEGLPSQTFVKLSLTGCTTPVASQTQPYSSEDANVEFQVVKNNCEHATVSSPHLNALELDLPKTPEGGLTKHPHLVFRFC